MRFMQLEWRNCEEVLCTGVDGLSTGVEQERLQVVFLDIHVIHEDVDTGYRTG